MKSITIHKIEPAVFDLIKQRAAAEERSINQTVKQLLEEALGIKAAERPRHIEDFREFCGRWSEEDLAAFEDAIRGADKVDAADWQ